MRHKQLVCFPCKALVCCRGSVSVICRFSTLVKPVLQIQLEGQGQPPITVADYLQQSFGYRYSFMGPVVGILLAFTVFFAGDMTSGRPVNCMLLCPLAMSCPVLRLTVMSPCCTPAHVRYVDMAAYSPHFPCIAALAVVSLKYMKFQVCGWNNLHAAHVLNCSDCFHRCERCICRESCAISVCFPALIKHYWPGCRNAKPATKVLVLPSHCWWHGGALSTTMGAGAQGCTSGT
jgi:CDR ABC transporter